MLFSVCTAAGTGRVCVCTRYSSEMERLISESVCLVGSLSGSHLQYQSTQHLTTPVMYVTAEWKPYTSLTKCDTVSLLCCFEKRSLSCSISKWNPPLQLLLIVSFYYCSGNLNILHPSSSHTASWELGMAGNMFVSLMWIKFNWKLLSSTFPLLSVFPAN